MWITALKAQFTIKTKGSPSHQNSETQDWAPRLIKRSFIIRKKQMTLLFTTLNSYLQCFAAVYTPNTRVSASEKTSSFSFHHMSILVFRRLS